MGEDSKPEWNEGGANPTVTSGLAAQTTRPTIESAAPPPDAQSKRPGWIKLLGIIAVAGALGYGVGTLGKPYVRRVIYGPAVPLQEGPRVEVSLRGDEVSRGPKDALVTIVAFSDYQCPYCAKAEKSLESFLESWEGEPVRVVYKNYPLPLHNNALPAAHSAWAAHLQNKFWPMHRWLYANRAKTEDLTDDVLEGLGLDVAKFKRDRQAPETLEAVDDDRRSGGMIRLAATPSFVINGHIYTANWNEQAWKDVVNWELKAAKELVAKGVPKDGVLERLRKEAEQGPDADKKEGAAEPSP